MVSPSGPVRQQAADRPARPDRRCDSNTSAGARARCATHFTAPHRLRGSATPHANPITRLHQHAAELCCYAIQKASTACPTECILVAYIHIAARQRCWLQSGSTCFTATAYNQRAASRNQPQLQCARSTCKKVKPALSSNSPPLASKNVLLAEAHTA